MRFIKFIIFLMILVSAYLAYQNLQKSDDVGTLQVYQGSAEITRASKKLSGTTGMAIKRADIVTTAADSRVAIILVDDSVVRLQGGSTVAIKDARTFEITEGRLWSRVEPLSAGETFQVETPTVVASVRGTRFGVDVLAGQSRIFVKDGRVAGALIKNRALEKIIEAGKLLDLRSDVLDADFAGGPKDAPKEFLEDAWIRFNDDEDSRFEAALKRKVRQAVADKITTLEISADDNDLKVGESTTLRVLATFENGTSRDVTSQIKWEQTNAIGDIRGRTFTAQKAGQTTLSVTTDAVTSNSIIITVSE